MSKTITDEIDRARLKDIVLKGSSVFLGLMLVILMLEITLRFLPVNEGSYLLPVDQQNPIWRFQPNRTFTWSSGWNFSIVNRVKTNNYGFVSDIDYSETETSPLIGIVGDSYVEAIMVPFPETISGRLAEHLKNEFRVYSFARSGAPLSQYLIYAEYARARFRPNGVIIVVVGNDFDESFMKYAYEPGHHHFLEKPNGELVLKRIDYSPTLAKRIARKSALTRYLMLHLGVLHFPQRFRNFITTDNQNALYVGQTLRNGDSERLTLSKKAVDAFFDRLPVMSGLSPTEVLFVIDGIRPDLYDEKLVDMAEGSFFDVMRKYFIAEATLGGYEVVDMQSWFSEHYKMHGKRFEYPTDGHWNGLGHKVVFDAISQSKFFARLRRRAQQSNSVQ
jgi:hypothetical protein